MRPTRHRSAAPINRPRILRIAAVSLVMFGVAALATTALRELRVIAFGRQAEGEIAMFQRTAAVVRFRTESGEAIEFRSLPLPRGTTYAMRQRVPVRYAASNPSLAYIDNYDGLYRNAIMGGAIGSLLVAGGLALFAIRTRTKTAYDEVAKAPERARSTAALVLTGLAIVAGVGFAYVRFRPVSVPVAEVEQVRREAAEIFAGLERPPGTTPYGEPSEYASAGSGARVRREQEFEAPGTYADTIAWSGTRLESQGWKVFDPSARSAVEREWCKAPWMITIENRAQFDGPPPTHRFVARLEWRSGFTADRCPVR